VEKNGQASIMASWRRLLLSAVACSALALGIGFISGTETRGLGQPGLLLLAVPAGLFGLLARRMFLGALGAPLLGFAGGVGLLWRLAPNAPHSLWLVLVFVQGSFGGLVCVLAGSLGGLLGDLLSDTFLPESETEA